MSLARQVLPGVTYMVTRRTQGQLLRLTSSPEVNQVLIYTLARAARRHGIEVIAFTFMGNHVHIILRDPRETLPFFCQEFFGNSGRALNVHYGIGGNFWDATPYSAVPLHDPVSIYEKIVYVLTNPVAMGGVPIPSQYPGLITLPRDLGQRKLTALRPTFFFRQPGDDDGASDGDETARDRHRLVHSGPASEREVLPDEESLTLVLPPVLPDGTSPIGREEELRRHVDDLGRRAVEQLHEERRRAGKHGWLGARHLLEQDPSKPPANGPTNPDGSLNPRLACRDRWKRAEHACGVAAWWRAHEEARVRYFLDGDRTARFPAGTWKAVHYLGALAHPA